MEAKGELLSVAKDYKSGGYQLAFHVEEINPKENLSGSLRIIAKKWRNKRSINANDYLWTLLQHIAVEVGSSKEEIYEEMLKRYGFLYEIEDGRHVTVTVSAQTEPCELPGHWRFYQSDGKWTAYLRIRGTSGYDTKEMSYFLDRVIEEAKALGIETATPDELERIKGYEKQRTG